MMLGLALVSGPLRLRRVEKGGYTIVPRVALHGRFPAAGHLLTKGLARVGMPGRMPYLIISSFLGYTPGTLRLRWYGAATPYICLTVWFIIGAVSIVTSVGPGRPKRHRQRSEPHAC